MNEKNMYNISFLQSLSKSYMMKENMDDKLRLKVLYWLRKAWKMLTKTDYNMIQNPEYYSLLVNSYQGAFAEFAAVVELDVRRTDAATKDPQHRKSLTNILNAYAK